MTPPLFKESGMNFGPYSEDDFFKIEQSRCYRHLGQGVKIAEFLWLRHTSDKPPAVWVIEAKSSSPKLEIAKFIADIRDKLAHSFLLGIAACLNRHSYTTSDLPASFKKLNLQETGFRFVLVINGHQEAWLPPLQEALSLALQPIVKIWGLPATSVVVLNHEGAKKQGLISS
jgi:hypothetical protein